MFPIFASTFTYLSAGDWTNTANWDAYPGNTLSISDSIIIDADLTLNASVTINGFNQVNATHEWKEVYWSKML